MGVTLKSLTTKFYFFLLMDKALSGKLSYTQIGLACCEVGFQSSKFQSVEIFFIQNIIKNAFNILFIMRVKFVSKVAIISVKHESELRPFQQCFDHYGLI